eukprot:1161003-Pelagomonas_calceolata.AAC.9
MPGRDTFILCAVLPYNSSVLPKRCTLFGSPFHSRLPLFQWSNQERGRHTCMHARLRLPAKHSSSSQKDVGTVLVTHLVQRWHGPPEKACNLTTEAGSGREASSRAQLAHWHQQGVQAGPLCGGQGLATLRLQNLQAKCKHQCAERAFAPRHGLASMNGTQAHALAYFFSLATIHGCTLQGRLQLSLGTEPFVPFTVGF